MKYSVMFIAIVLSSVFGCGKKGDDNRQTKTPPEEPTWIMITVLNEEKMIKLEFQDEADNEDGFRIYRNVNGDEMRKIAELPPSNGIKAKIVYLDRDIIEYQKYCYWISVFSNTLGESRIILVNCLEPKFPPPAPTNVTICYEPRLIYKDQVPHHQAIVKLRWQDNSPDEYAFWIFRKEANISDWYWVGDVGGNVIEFEDTNANFGKNYQYYVVAKDDGFISDQSNIVQITTNEIQTEAIGSWPAGLGAEKVFIDEPYIYMASNQMIYILKLTPPNSFEDINFLISEGKIIDMNGDSDFLYAIVDGKQTDYLQIFRISNPESAENISTKELSERSLNTIVADLNRAYVSCPTSIVALDISNRNDVKEIGKYKTENAVKSIFLSNSKLYAAIEKVGLVILDATKPEPTLLGKYQTRDEALDIEVRGDKAYIGGSTGLTILNVSDPKNITEIYFKAIEHKSTVIRVDDKYAFLQSYDCQTIVDIVNPSRPRIVEQGCYVYVTFKDLEIHFPYVYNASYPYGLVIDDYSHLPDNETVFVANYRPPGDSWVPVIKDKYCFIADYYGGLYIVDISDPTLPIVVGHHLMPGHAVGGMPAHSVFIQDDYAYIPAGPSGLRIINIKDKTKPFEEAFYGQDGTWYRGVYVRENLAYIAHSGYNLLIVDIQKRPPTLLGSCRLGEPEGSQVVVDGNYAYITRSGPTLEIVDVSDFSHPQSVATYQSGAVGNIMIQGDHAYLAGNLGFEILDIANPKAPKRIGFWPESSLWGMAILDTIAYISSGKIWSVDISDPKNPITLGCYEPDANNIRGITIANGLMYAAGSHKLLEVLKFEPVNTTICR